MRDAAVAAIVETELRSTRTVDRDLLDRVSDPATKQRLVRIAVPSVVRDPAQARELIERYVFDPAERRAALEELERLQP
jgi:hypothetical protein